MGKTQKINQLVRRFLHKSEEYSEGSSGSARRPSFSSSGCSQTSSESFSWSRSSANFDLDCDCTGDECCSSPPPDVPAGCLPVYVGAERRRFVIPTSYLSSSAFHALLAKSEEEYGLRCEGDCESRALPMLLSTCCGRCRSQLACAREVTARVCS